ncbi:hypothetical protein [Undibacterium aquatile]|uniref:Uncharacterized protein n=1 Tax=Undibacterium aquatile TaxID=1537398 RepID=A0ABR6XAE0_9BURK|nr:hypothetical protein [Undibacterium aquatile]MBC3809871.1 hypothetical protein [Undibacterium aquatile]
MTIKDIVGLIFCGAGATLGTIGYRLLGLEWFFGACILLIIGTCLIWDASRDRKLRDALDDVPGDSGDRHYISGTSSTDGFDVGGDDGDAS